MIAEYDIDRQDALETPEARQEAGRGGWWAIVPALSLALLTWYALEVL